MPLNNSPKKRAGRPRKHSSAAAAIEAKKQSDRRRYLRGLQARGPADFIAYEPPRADTPADTPPTGLRTSPDIRIPLDDNTQPDGVLENTRLASPPTQPLVSDEEVQVTAQLEQIQIEEQELNRERDEHEAEISQKLDAMDAAAVGILVEMQSASINNRVEEAVWRSIPSIPLGVSWNGPWTLRGNCTMEWIHGGHQWSGWTVEWIRGSYLQHFLVDP